jgi:hypothetical protein
MAYLMSRGCDEKGGANLVQCSGLTPCLAGSPRGVCIDVQGRVRRQVGVVRGCPEREATPQEGQRPDWQSK